MSRVSARLVLLLMVLPPLSAVAVGCKREDGRHAAEGERKVMNLEGAWFTDVTDEVDLDFVHETGATGQYYYAEIMAGGVALFDYDNDGDLDVYFINGNRNLPDLSPSATDCNRLFEQASSVRFQDVTERAGLCDGGYGMGVAIGDIDNDGWTDVYVSNFGPDRLYRNRGDGTFEDVTMRARIDVTGWSCSAAFLDYNRDGFLDLYVTRYIEFNPVATCFDLAGRPDYCGPTSAPPMHDVLLRNNGDGTFTDVSHEAGIASSASAGLGVVFDDFNDDGWPDVYVANDAYANYLWINQGDGTFRDEALVRGVALNMDGRAEAGMGVVAADFDNDLQLDIFLTHLRQESNTLYRNLGGSLGFNDASGASGLGSPSLPFTGFGTVAIDVKQDGFLDLVVVNGRVIRGEPLSGAYLAPPWHYYGEPDQLFLNDRHNRFKPIGPPAAQVFERIAVSRGLAAGDIDGDGDMDLVVSNLQDRARVYRNDAPGQGRFLLVRAVDPRLRRDAIGARITLSCGSLRLLRTISSTGSYLSASEPIAHFGLGDCPRVVDLEVRWPDGMRERFADQEVDQTVRVVRGTGRGRR